MLPPTQTHHAPNVSNCQAVSKNFLGILAATQTGSIPWRTFTTVSARACFSRWTSCRESKTNTGWTWICSWSKALSADFWDTTSFSPWSDFVTSLSGSFHLVAMVMWWRGSLSRLLVVQGEIEREIRGKLEVSPCPIRLFGSCEGVMKDAIPNLVNEKESIYLGSLTCKCRGEKSNYKLYYITTKSAPLC